MKARTLLILSVALLAPTAFAAKQPNVVYILVDNWGRILISSRAKDFA